MTEYLRPLVVKRDADDVGLIIDVDTAGTGLRIERAENMTPGGMLMVDAAQVRALRDWLNANVRD